MSRAETEVSDVHEPVRETYTMVITRYFGNEAVDYRVTYDAETHEAIEEVEL